MIANMLARRAARRATRAATEAAGDRAQQMGRALRMRDDALWNPFEVVALVFLIIFAFGFLLGRSHYLFVIELFSPVIVIGVAVVAYQTVQRIRRGPDPIGTMRGRRAG